MENRKTEKLDDIRRELLDIRSRIDALISGLDGPDPIVDDEPIDIGLDDVTVLAEMPFEAGPENEPEPAEAQTVPEPETLEPETERGSECTENLPESKRPVAAAAYSWEIDMPAPQVSNIISGISLNDRVLFINSIFNEDPCLFQKSISAFNAMSTLNEAKEYISQNFPDWNMNSEVVYRMMMAIRRKLR